MQEEPPYRRIAAELRHRIVTGELRPGDRVPSTRRLTRECGVAMATATKALDVLRAEGLVRTVSRVGTVVAGPEAVPVTLPAAPRRPARDGRLTRDAIVAAAIDGADRDGLDALSMRSLAGRLGFPTMSLYRHVRGKDELILLMIDEAFGEAAFPDPPPAGWRARLEVAARMQWASYRRHPWLAQVISGTRPQPLASLFRYAEWSLAALAELDLRPNAMFDIHFTVANYVRGIAVNLVPEAEATADTGLTGDEWAEAAESVRALVTSGRFPALRRAAAHGNYPFDLDALFEFGLSRLLDGVASFASR